MNPVTILRIIEISRPIFWPSTFLVFLLGIVFSHHSITPLVLFFAFIWSFPYSLWISTVNDLEDGKTDRLNRFKGGISGARIQQSEEKFIKKLVWVSFGTIMFPTLLTLNFPLILSSLVALFIPYIYSTHPFRLKEKPPLDSLSNGAFVTFVFISGYVFNSNFRLEVMFIQAALALFFGVSAIHIIGALRDYTPDKKAHIRTIAVVWSQRLSAFFASFLFFLVFVVIYQFPLEFRLYAILGIIISQILAIKPNERRSMQLGFTLVILFFIVSAYSLLFNSWYKILAF